MLSNLKKEFKVVGPLYAIEALWGLSEVIGPVWVIYFLAIGLAPTQIGLLFVAWTMMGMLFEIPTGAISDHFGRRISVAVSFLVNGVLLALVAFAHSFLPLLVIFAIFGAFDAMHEAAINAWMVDALKHGKGERFMHKCLSRKKSFSTLFMIPAFLLTSAILFYGISGEHGFVAVMKYIWILAGVLSCACGVVALLAKERYFKPKKLRFAESFRNTIELSKKGLKYTLKHPVLLKLAIGNGFFLYAGLVMMMAWQPYFKDVLGLDPIYFGIILAGSAFISFIALNTTPNLIKRIRHERDASILLVLMSCAAVFFFTWSTELVLILIAFYVFWTMSDLVEPLLVHWFNQHVPSETRATTMSVWNLFRWLFVAFGMYFGYGLATEWLGIKAALYLSIVMGLVGILIYMWIEK